MNQSDAKRLVKNINKARILIPKVNEYLEKHKSIKTNSDGIAFLREFLKSSPHRWHYVHEELLTYSSCTKEYSQFVMDLVKDDDKYMATALSEVYKTKPDLFEFLYKEFLQSKNPNIAAAFGIMLGGVGMVDSDKLFDMLQDKRINHPAVVLLNAIYVSGYEIPRNIFLAVIKHADSKDQRIRAPAIFILMTKFDKDPQTLRCLLKLVRSSVHARNQIISLTNHIYEKNPSLCLNLLKACMNVSDKTVRKNAMVQLDLVYPYMPVECLLQMRRWLKTAEYGEALGVVTRWSLESVKHKDVAKISSFLLDWIEKNHSPLLPIIISAIFRNHPDQLLSLLKKIPCNQKKTDKLLVRVLYEFLSGASEEFIKSLRMDDTYTSIFSDDAKKNLFLDNVKKILTDVAQKQGVDTVTDKSLSHSYLRVMALLQNIRHHKKRIDPNVVKRALVNYPDIAVFFEQRNIHELIDSDHPLARLLFMTYAVEGIIKQCKDIIRTGDLDKSRHAHDLLLNQYHPNSFMVNLDTSLKNLGTADRIVIENMLKNPCEFYSVFTQLNVYHRFKRAFCNADLEPPISPSSLDVATVIDGKKYYFEIYTPREDKKFEYLSTAHMVDPRHIQSKVYRKLVKQIKSAHLHDIPVILIINNVNMAVDRFDVENMMRGTFETITEWSSLAGKVVGEHTQRHEDSFGRNFEHGDMISATMVIQSYVDNADLKIKLGGQTMPHIRAKYPIDQKIIQKIEKALFGTVID